MIIYSDTFCDSPNAKVHEESPSPYMNSSSKALSQQGIHKMASWPTWWVRPRTMLPPERCHQLVLIHISTVPQKKKQSLILYWVNPQVDQTPYFLPYFKINKCNFNSITCIRQHATVTSYMYSFTDSHVLGDDLPVHWAERTRATSYSLQATNPFCAKLNTNPWS